MPISLNTKNVSTYKSQLTAEQDKQIRDMYEEILKKFKQKTKQLGNEHVTDLLQMQQLKAATKQLQAAILAMSTSFGNIISTTAEQVAQKTIENSVALASSLGIKLSSSAEVYMLPKHIVANIWSGNVYGPDWSYSKALWGDSKQTNIQINMIVAKGIAENKSAFDIAKDLETYVSPSAKKPWDWNKVYPGSGKQVDYNAQRLARTLSAHAHQQATVTMAAQNPFSEFIRWIAGNSHGRTCPLCMERAEGDHGFGPGLYKKNEVPLDHPNGLCTVVEEIGDMNQIADRVAKWVKGEEDPELDNYAFFLENGYAIPKKEGGFEKLNTNDVLSKASSNATPIQAAQTTITQDVACKIKDSTWAGHLTDIQVEKAKKLSSDSYNLQISGKLSKIAKEAGVSYQDVVAYLKGNISTSGVDDVIDLSIFTKKQLQTIADPDKLHSKIITDKLVALQNATGKTYKEIVAYIEKNYAKEANAATSAVKSATKSAVKQVAKPKVVKAPPVNGELRGLSTSAKLKNAKTFRDGYEADGYLRTVSGNRWRAADDTMKDSAYQYTSGSGKFNRPLRGYSNTWNNYKGVGSVNINNEGGAKFIEGLTRFIDGSQYPDDVVLRRGIESREGAKAFFGNIRLNIASGDESSLRKALLGKVFKDEGFTSCGVSEGKGFSGVCNLKILAPKGTKMVYAEPFSKYGDGNQRDWDGRSKQSSFGSEQEVILQRGSIFQVLDVSVVNGKTNVTLEVIGQDTSTYDNELSENVVQRRKKVV